MLKELVMKLDAAAARLSPFRSPRIVRIAGASCLVFALLLPGGALALDGIDLSEPSEPVAAGECPRLIQIKYPFLSCVDGGIEGIDADATWENSRRIPLQSRFIEGNGFWGDDRNSD